MVDPINPAHYKQGGIETFDVIQAWKLDYCLGNTVKYISRAGKKNPNTLLEDLEKAQWYLNKKIFILKAEPHKYFGKFQKSDCTEGDDEQAY